MSVIKITVDEQNLHITDSPKIAAQGVNENQVEFTFSADWDGFGKIALFYREEDEETVYESAIDEDGKALVPHEVTDQRGKICIGVAGVKDDVIHTSEILKYKVVNGLYTAGESSQPPTPGIYEQILSIVGSIYSDQTVFIDSIRSEQTEFENDINDLIDNTPYLTTVEDEEFELPVHTINDSETADDSTWSSEKITDHVQGDIDSATTWKLLRTTPFSPAGENYWVEIPQTAKEIIVAGHITYTPSTKVSVMFHVPVLPHFFTVGAIHAIVNYYGSTNDGYARLDCSVIDNVNKVRLYSLNNGNNDITAACNWDVFYR